MTNKKRYCYLIFTIIFVIFLLSSCNNKYEKLMIGIIPIRNDADILKDFEPIRVYLEDQLEIPIEMKVTNSYANLVEEMKNKTVDIGLYGAFSYVIAESELELTPLVVQQRKGTGTHYHSLIIASKESGIDSIEQLEGKDFAFVDTGSTSGFVLPYALLKSRNIDYENYFNKVFYSGSHELVTTDILNGKVDAGAISSVQFDHFIKDKIINKDSFDIIWESENIPLSLFVARSELNINLQEDFVHAMLNVHKEIPEELFEMDEDLEKYIIAEDSDYNSIRNIATILGKESMVEYFLKGN